MTITHPSASDSGLNLDHLEALAKAATPQNLDSAECSTRPNGWIECPECGGDGTVELTADYCNYDDTAMGVQFYGVGPEHQAAEAFFRAANPAAVLALIALARRAQPENEAPQVEQKMTPEKLKAFVRANFDDLEAVVGAIRGNTPLAPAATLSPLCGAQHAESGKEAESAYQRGYMDGISKGRRDAAEDAKDSAPGTPEAPAEDRKGIELWRATLRACGELPEGYEVRIELENGCGMAVWYDAEGERHVIDGEGYLSDDVNEAVDAAIQRAAQLDGGQEGSAT